MGRPSRSWVRKTYTVSPQIVKAVALRAAEQGIDPGTVMDVLVWHALLKPDGPGLQKGGFSPDELERIFAEQVLEILRDDSAVASLADELTLVYEDEPRNLMLVKSLVQRWRKTRLIDKDHQESVLEFMRVLGLQPSLVDHGCVDLGWFAPK